MMVNDIEWMHFSWIFGLCLHLLLRYADILDVITSSFFWCYSLEALLLVALWIFLSELNKWLDPS